MVLIDGLRPVVLGVVAGLVLGAIGRGEMRALIKLMPGAQVPPPMAPTVAVVASIAVS